MSSHKHKKHKNWLISLKPGNGVLVLYDAHPGRIRPGVVMYAYGKPRSICVKFTRWAHEEEITVYFDENGVGIYPEGATLSDLSQDRADYCVLQPEVDL